MTVVEERRNGIGHGDLEIEGRVEQIVVVNPAGDSRFVIDGQHRDRAPRHDRPSARAIAPAWRRRSTLGRQVHVKGVWQPTVPPATQEVLAWEIKLQGPAVGPSPVPRPVSVAASPGQTCMINGGRRATGSSSRAASRPARCPRSR